MRTVLYLLLIGMLCTLASGVDLPSGDPADYQSTTGSIPPPNMHPGVSPSTVSFQKLIVEVPSYIWHHGCGPTAAAMVVGYWDQKGFGHLAPGDANIQSPGVNNMISSQGNYEDYCLPIDSYPLLIEDRSGLPYGSQHPNDSIADFMNTSRSSHGNYYGWSWFSDVANGLYGHIGLTEPMSRCSVYQYFWSSSLWNEYCYHIDCGHPAVMMVDSDADGVPDHFVTAIGYGKSGNKNMYACYNTWDKSVHWYEFGDVKPNQPFGVYGVAVVVLTEPSIPEIKLYEDFTGGNVHGAVVTAVFGDFFYICSPEGASGLRVFRPGHELVPGTRINLFGSMFTNSNGERYLDTSGGQLFRDGTRVLSPKAMNLSSLGGTNWRTEENGGQRGVVEGKGLNNIGVLVRVCGEVTYKGSSFIYIEDGSNLRDITGHRGVRVVVSENNLKDVHTKVVVTGISSCFRGDDGRMYRQVLAVGSVEQL